MVMRNVFLISRLLSFALICLSISSAALAQDRASSRLSEKAFEPDVQSVRGEAPLPRREYNQESVSTGGAEAQNVRLTVAELAEHPELMERVLAQALVQFQVKTVESIMRHYQPELKFDNELMLWADAVVDFSAGRYSKAITKYRRLNAIYPRNLSIRLQLAIALFNNYENEAARDQFERLRADSKEESIQQITNNFLAAIDKRDAFNWHVGASYISDSNINNAPDPNTYIGFFKAPEAERGKGLNLRIDMDKTFVLKGNYFAFLDMSLTGKVFFDAKRHNEMTLRFNPGIGYRTANFQARLGGFFERNWYVGSRSQSYSFKTFSDEKGFNLALHRWLSPKWSLSGYFEAGYEKHRRHQYLVGQNYLLSGTLAYISSSTQSWRLGTDLYRRNAHEKGSAYDLKNIRIGWHQDWPKGVSSYLQLSYARRDYKGKKFFFNIDQKNNERGAFLSLWLRDFHFLGMTPRLNLSYQNVRSNFAFDQYDKRRVFFELSKRF